MFGKQPTKANQFILSENSILRYFTFSSLYVAQGIPEGLTFFAIPAWMAANGKSAGEIGVFIGIIGIPWSFKIIVAPLMDRFSYLPMGKRRPWVLFGQLGLIMSFFSMALVNDPLNNITSLMFVGFFISFFGAFQDVAVDGMAIDIIPINEQARANGLMWGSKTLGISVSLAVSTFIINTYGFYYAVVTLATIVMCIFLIPLFFRENPGEKIMPWTKGEASIKSISIKIDSWKEIIINLKNVFILPSSLLMGIAAFTIAAAFGLMDAILPVFTIQEIGWTNSDFSEILAMAKIVGGILGMLVGGVLVDFFGKIRMMSIYLFSLIAIVIAIVFFKNYWNAPFIIPSFIIGYTILDTFLHIAIFAAAMQLCWKRISATQFTLYMAISNIGAAFGASILGVLKEYLINWEYVIFIFAIAAVFMFLFIRKINFDSHLFKVENLELNYDKIR